MLPRTDAGMPLVALQCRRTLPADAGLTLVWGQGVAAPNGIPTMQDQELAFRTRPDFRLSRQKGSGGMPAPMWDVSGVAGAAPVWRDVMDHLHRERPGRQPAAPDALLRRRVAFARAHEPAREEWFLRGTERALVEAVPAGRRTPKIVYPVDGGIVAVDPDIPDRQGGVDQSLRGAEKLNRSRRVPSPGSHARPAVPCPA